MTHITDCFFAPGIVNGYDAEPIEAGTGLFEGTALFLMLFALAIAGLARRLRKERDGGGRTHGVHLGAIPWFPSLRR
jgi:hypothetical protein